MSDVSSDRRFAFHPRAASELLAGAQYLRGDDPQVATEFEREVSHALELLVQHPEIGTVIQERRGRPVRKWRLEHFRYSLVYSADEAVVRILAVAHQRRRPDYWLSRLRGA